MPRETQPRLLDTFRLIPHDPDTMVGINLYGGVVGGGQFLSGLSPPSLRPRCSVLAEIGVEQVDPGEKEDSDYAISLKIRPNRSLNGRSLHLVHMQFETYAA